MSRKSRSNEFNHNHSRRFIDDVTGETGYTDSFKVDHRGRMVKTENWDPVPSQEIFLNIKEEIAPKWARPKAPLIYKSYKEVYNFPSSYLDRIKFYPNGILLGELNPDLVTIQLANIQSWEEIDVVWNSGISAFTNTSWNQNINFVDNIFDEVYTFGERIETRDIRLPGED